MNAIDFDADARSLNVDTNILLAIFDKAARILERDSQYCSLGEEGSKLLFDVWCSYSLIRKTKHLGAYVEMIGWDHYYALLAEMSGLEWGEEDGILCAYLHYVTENFMNEDCEPQDMKHPQTKH